MTDTIHSNTALFLDRDGVINVDYGYVWQTEKLKLKPGITRLLKYFTAIVDFIIVVSNQSGIGRGMYTIDDWNLFNSEIQRILTLSGVSIDKFYCCPHLPSINPPCDCRKPKSGMIMHAKQEFKIDLKRSILIGDRQSDIQAAMKAGLNRAYLLSSSDDPQFSDHGKIDFYAVKQLSEIVSIEEGRQ